jgi:glutathione S-transferase
MIRLYDYLPSGNGYKVRLLLTQLQIPFERIELDIIKGTTRTPEFLRKFPNGRIPAVEFDDGRRLFESSAIMWHFAETTELVPTDAFERARALQWMFFEQYSHEPYIAVARFLAMHPDYRDERRAGLPRIIKGGYDALGVMESHLGGGGEGDHAREFFVGGRYSIADIALYAYTHVAHEGDFDLANYPAIREWLARVKSQPRHILITQG